ncbi:CLUMA_CG003792, isoform A [Clunio marinus]|uniref:CLUMA_CG003792, isoform A n=1 Tax=Clunio marinus TaxID=568069 RepID=A0A1J1HV88_9DIPT|nr:CLUMA_CG003792, isoform A [Clunio marinus]
MASQAHNSMILGSDCRLVADADPSNDFGPAQLLLPPSSLIPVVNMSKRSFYAFIHIHKRPDV